MSRLDWWGTVLDAPDAPALARFYASLLGWELGKQEPNYAVIAPADGVTYLGFQTAPEYVRPVWPPAAGSQQMMMHLDFEVSDLETAVAHALELEGSEGVSRGPIWMSGSAVFRGTGDYARVLT